MCESNHPINPNNSTEKDPYLEDNKSLPSQEITRDLWNLPSPPMPAIHSYTSCINTAQTSILRFISTLLPRLLMGLSSGSFPVSLLPHTCNMQGPFHPSCLSRQKDNGRMVQIINPHIIQISRAFSSFWRFFNHEYNSYFHFTSVIGMQVQLLISIF